MQDECFGSEEKKNCTEFAQRVIIVTYGIYGRTLRIGRAINNLYYIGSP